MGSWRFDAATSRVVAPEPIDSQRRLVLPLGHTQLGCALQRRGSLACRGLLGVARSEWDAFKTLVAVWDAQIDAFWPGSVEGL